MSLYTAPATSTTIVDGSIVDADVNASAAIAGTKISPDFGAQNVTTTGTSTAASYNPTSSTVPTNGAYLPAANTYGIAAGGAERLRVTSTGQVRLAGAGITFNGDTATANELDDYEEGTWTPAFSFSTSGSVTYSVQDGIYTKIGNIVIARASLVLTGVSSPTGNASITGLPFTASSRIGSGTIGIARNFASAGLPLSVYAGNSSTSILIMKNATNAGTSQLQGSDLTATTNFYLTVIYSV